MDAKQIKLRIAELVKATQEKQPAPYVLDILNTLKKDIVVTEKLLRDTNVGKEVNKLRNHSDKRVSELALDIVSRWRAELKPSKPADQPRKRATASPANGATATSPVEKSDSKPAKKVPQPNVPPGQRSKEGDRANYKVTGDGVRDTCLGMIYDGLCFESEATTSEILTVARAIELAVFSTSKKTDMAYKNKIRSLYLNLKDKKNPHLRRRVTNGDITPQRLSTMTSQEMASEERKQEDKKLEEENMREAMAAKSISSFTDQFPCGKCGKRKVSYSQAQTRSADEPMTTFCECQNCGHRWKFS